MDRPLDERIRERAYFLWLESGERGDDIYFWLIAEREIMGEATAEAGTADESTAPAATANTTRRVNALVQLDPAADREQAA